MRRLFTILITTFALMCAGCAAIGFMQNTVDINRGTLVVTAGTSVEELRRKTTFDLGNGSKHRATETRTFANAARFDWQLPGTNLTFKDCSNYFLTTDEKGETIEEIQIITAQKYLMWDELKAELIDIEQRLLADGWKPYVSSGGKSEPQRLKQELANPPLRAATTDGGFSVNEFGGYTYFKGDVVLMLSAKRPEINQGENPLSSEKFTHFVNVKTRAKWDE